MSNQNLVDDIYINYFYTSLTNNVTPLMRMNIEQGAISPEVKIDLRVGLIKRAESKEFSISILDNDQTPLLNPTPLQSGPWITLANTGYLATEVIVANILSDVKYNQVGVYTVQITDGQNVIVEATTRIVAGGPLS